MGRGLSITSFVLSLLIFIPFLPLVGAILGIFAVKKAKNEDDLKGLAIAAIILGAVFSVAMVLFILFYQWPYTTGLKLNSLSTDYAMPAEMLTLNIKIPNSLMDKEISVRFTDDENYKVDIPLKWYNSQAAIVSVPFYFTETGNFSSGIVNVALVATSEGEENVSNSIKGFEIQAPAIVNEKPGTITLRYLTRMIEDSNLLIENLDKVDITNVSTNKLREGLVKQRDYLANFKTNLNNVMQNPSSTYNFGKLNGVDLNLNKESLALSDRLIATYLLVYQQKQEQAKQTSGITGNVVLTDQVTIESLGESFDSMFKDIGKGLRANKETMTSLGGTLGAIGGAITVVPGGQVVGPLVAGVGAIMWFTGLHINTAFIMAADASIDSALDKNSNSVQADVQEYLQELFMTGASTAASEYGEFPGYMYDSISSLKSTLEYLKKFIADSDKSLGKVDSEDDEDENGDNISSEDTLLLMVGRQGTGSGTITSDSGGISCPGKCSQEYAIGSTVTLSAQPSSGSTFSGWTGHGCTGKGVCIVTIEEDIADKGIIAFMGKFDKNQIPVAKRGRCSGAANSNQCGACNSNADCGGSQCWTSASTPPFC